MIKAYFSKRKFNIILSACAFFTMWLIWLIAYYSVRNDYIIPSFSETIKSFGVCLISADFWTAFVFTVLRTAGSFAISFVFATALAVVLILLFWTTPSVAPVVVTVLVLFPMIYAQLYAAVKGIDGGIIEMAEVYGIAKRERLTKMYLPMISPSILAQTGANISLGIKVMISAEVLAGTYESMGGLMQNARVYVDMPRLAALTLIAVLTGLCIDLCFSFTEKFTFKWSKKESCA